MPGQRVDILRQSTLKPFKLEKRIEEETIQHTEQRSLDSLNLPVLYGGLYKLNFCCPYNGHSIVVIHASINIF